jgi:hypothetical protein
MKQNTSSGSLIAKLDRFHWFKSEQEAAFLAADPFTATT